MNLSEIERCKNDIVYFVENYVTVKNYKGYQKLKLKDFQKDLLRKYETEKYNLVMAARQTYHSINIKVFLGKYLKFNENKTVVLFVLKNNDRLVELSQILDSIEVWHKFEDKETLITAGNNKVILMHPKEYPQKDEIIADLIEWDSIAYYGDLRELWKNVYPKIAAHDTRVIISSQPRGKNYFKDLWEGAVKGENVFTATRVDWDVIPHRDDEWVKNEKEYIGEDAFNQQYGLSFDV